MTRSELTAAICSLCIPLSLCIAVLGAQGARRHAAAQPTAAFSIGPIRHPHEGLDAWPKVTAPRTPAVEHANAIISAMNRETIGDFWDCEARADWERRITVTMRGPRLIAMTDTETLFCGNAYPFNDHAAVVFDMTTGELVDWKEFLEGVDGVSTMSGKSIDGATSSEVVMPSLTQLAVGRADPECKKVLKDSGELVFQIWPDARRGQLMIKATGQPHVTQACEETIGLSVSEARKLGFSREVLEAIEQAHRIEGSSQKR